MTENVETRLDVALKPAHDQGRRRFPAYGAALVRFRRIMVNGPIICLACAASATDPRPAAISKAIMAPA
jgi:hypothetical protein